MRHASLDSRMNLSPVFQYPQALLTSERQWDVSSCGRHISKGPPGLLAGAEVHAAQQDLQHLQSQARRLPGSGAVLAQVLCVLLHSLSVLLLFLLYYFLKWYSDNNTPKTPCTLACPGQCQSPLLGTGCPHTGPPLWNWTCGSAIIQLKHPFTKWLWLWFQAQMAKQDCSWQLALQCIRNSNNPSPGCVHCLPPHFISLVSYLIYKSWVATKFRSAYTISFFASISL